MRSRAVRRDLACWLSMALGPPPSQIFSSSLRIWATRSASARMLDSKRSEAGSTLVARTLLIAIAVDSVRSDMRAESGLSTISAGRGVRCRSRDVVRRVWFGERAQLEESLCDGILGDGVYQADFERALGRDFFRSNEKLQRSAFA